MQKKSISWEVIYSRHIKIVELAQVFLNKFNNQALDLTSHISHPYSKLSLARTIA